MMIVFYSRFYYVYIYVYIYIYIYMYVLNANGDGRNGQTTQAGAAVAQALMMAVPCGI